MAILSRAVVLESLRHDIRGPLFLRLFANDFTPYRDQALSDFTEAAFPGYSPIPLEPAAWVESPGDSIILTHPEVVWHLSDDLDSHALVHGWYMTRGDTVVMADYRGATKLEIARSRIKVTPVIKES